jgi:hypothetical protein
MKSIAAHPRKIARIAFADVVFAGVASSLGEVTKGTGGRRVAPHFAQKMSPASMRVPHCGQMLSATTFRVASSMKDVSYASGMSAIAISTAKSEQLRALGTRR